MGVFYTNWEIAGVLMQIGENIAKACSRYNHFYDMYGIDSVQCQYEIGSVQMGIDAINSFPDLSIELETDRSCHYKKVQILAYGSPCGLPWNVEDVQNEKCRI